MFNRIAGNSINPLSQILLSRLSICCLRRNRQWEKFSTRKAGKFDQFFKSFLFLRVYVRLLAWVWVCAHLNERKHKLVMRVEATNNLISKIRIKLHNIFYILESFLLLIAQCVQTCVFDSVE